MFSHYPSRYTSSPFDSYYYDPYRAATLQQQQRQRQLELEAARREQARLLQARRLRAQEEEARRREAYLEHLRNQQQYYCQPEEEEEDGEEEQYYQHPFFPFGFAPQPQSQRRQPSPPVQQPARRQSPQQQQQQQQQRRRSASPKFVHIPIDGDDVQSFANPQHESYSVPINVAPSSPARSPRPSAEDLERRTAAASTIQSHWRTHVIRKRAFAQISAIRDAFTSLQRSFTFPSAVDFITSPSSLSPSTIDIVPALAYTSSNRPILSYEHSATELLTRLDAVDSAGDKDVRRARKALVDEIEAALRVLEGKKGEAWRRLSNGASAEEEEQAQVEVESEMLLEQERTGEASMEEEDPTTHSGPHTETPAPAVGVATPTEPQSQSQSEPATPSSPSTAALSPVPVAIVIDPTLASTSSPASHSDADIDTDIVLVDQPSQHTTTPAANSKAHAADEMEDDAEDDDWVDASDEAWIDALALPDRDEDEQDEKDVEMQLDTAPASTLAAAASDRQ